MPGKPGPNRSGACPCVKVKPLNLNRLDLNVP